MLPSDEADIEFFCARCGKYQPSLFGPMLERAAIMRTDSEGKPIAAPQVNYLWRPGGEDQAMRPSMAARLRAWADRVALRAHEERPGAAPEDHGEARRAPDGRRAHRGRSDRDRVEAEEPGEGDLGRDPVGGGRAAPAGPLGVPGCVRRGGPEAVPEEAHGAAGAVARGAVAGKDGGVGVTYRIKIETRAGCVFLSRETYATRNAARNEIRRQRREGGCDGCRFWTVPA